MGRGAFVVLFVFLGVPHVHAQAWNCSTIQPGDTASGMAARMTGDADNRHAASFQIVESGSGQVIPKARYARIQPGWRACTAAQHTPAAGVQVPAAPTGIMKSLWNSIASVLRYFDSPVLLFGLFVVAVAFLWNGCEKYFTARQKRLLLMQHFGRRFVREFELPLLQPGRAAAPIRARLRAHPGPGRLDVCLAPNAGRRYPNLSDHKDNVVYDIARVSQLLRDPCFVSSAPYTQAGWVVIPFQFQDRVRQAGGS